MDDPPQAAATAPETLGSRIGSTLANPQNYPALVRPAVQAVRGLGGMYDEVQGALTPPAAVQPSGPGGSWSDVNEAQQQANEGAYNNAQTKLAFDTFMSMVGANLPFRESGTIGVAGGAGRRPQAVQAPSAPQPDAAATAGAAAPPQPRTGTVVPGGISQEGSPGLGPQGMGTVPRGTGLSSVDYRELPPEQSHIFKQAVAESKAASPYGSAVTLHPDYSGMRTFLAPDNRSGFALNGDEVVSVFRHPASPHANAAWPMMERAIAEGGRRLDAYDPKLPEIYSKSGFNAVSRVPFDPQQAPADWNQALQGQPDVVAMVHDPAHWRGPYAPGAGQAAPDYEAMINKQRAVAASNRQQQVLNEPQRMAHPGIYKHPVDIAREAQARVAPEHPALKQLFGVNRQDLWEMSGRGARPGGLAPQYPTTAGTENYAAQNVMTPANAQRLVDALGESYKHAPDLIPGMQAWYVMDPLYQRYVRMFGPEEGLRRYQQSNTAMAMHSPASDVDTEINRGTAANMMQQQGRLADYIKYGGLKQTERGPDFPAELRDVVGHPYHSTSQAGPYARYVQTGEVNMSQPKVPLYIQASGPPGARQTSRAVPDAHIARSIGMADVRKTAQPGVSMKTGEYTPIGPWYEQQVAQPLGLQAVPAQGHQWGLFAPQTGVETPIGAPKLEIMARRAWERAQKLGIDPNVLMDRVMQGKEHLVRGGAAARALAVARRPSAHP